MEQIIKENDKITFINRPLQVPYNYRVVYNVCKIVLIIGKTCRRGGCSTLKLHIISNAISSNNTFLELEKFIKNVPNTFSIMKFEPALTRAINYTLAEGLVERQVNGKIRLTEKGKRVYQQILDDEEIMILEKENLDNISSKLTDDKIEQILANWRNMDVCNK